MTQRWERAAQGDSLRLSAEITGEPVITPPSPARVGDVMVAGFLVTVLLLAFCSAVYSVLQAGLKTARAIGQSIQEHNEQSQRYKARCATCGVDFLENRELEDGICVDCQRIVCSRCATKDWRCPYCNKKRFENENQNRHFGRRETSYPSIIHILNAKDDNSSLDSLSKWSIEDSMLNGSSGYNTSSTCGKSKLPDFGSDFSNDWSSDYESDAGRSTAAESWESNWLFKKKLPTAEHMQPLAMWVPQPNKVSRARIGGVDVDDLSDFSDYSDSEIDEIIK